MMKIADEARGNFGGFRFSAVCPTLMSLSREPPNWNFKVALSTPMI